LQGEQTVQDSIKAGADIVTFSGDKLLGGPQAGLIAGNRTLIEELRTNPLARALRIGKLTVAALESTLRLYTDPDTVKLTIPTLRYLSRPIAEIEQCASLLADQLRGVMNGVSIDVTDGCSEVGGGSLPGEHLPTKLVALSSTEPGLANPMDLARAFRTGDPPVFGRVGENRFLLDMRTVEESDIADIVRGAQHIICT
jgi:L-seryl-tRNA(Ser) seleniumtransferase